MLLHSFETPIRTVGRIPSATKLALVSHRHKQPRFGPYQTEKIEKETKAKKGRRVRAEDLIFRRYQSQATTVPTIEQRNVEPLAPSGHVSWVFRKIVANTLLRPIAIRSNALKTSRTERIF